VAFSAGGDGGRRSPEYLAVQFAKRLFAAACDCRLTNGCAWNAVSAFANCGRAVALVRGSYVPPLAIIGHASFDHLVGA
jgi:hypothetical protein